MTRIPPSSYKISPFGLLMAGLAGHEARIEDLEKLASHLRASSSVRYMPPLAGHHVGMRASAIAAVRVQLSEVRERFGDLDSRLDAFSIAKQQMRDVRDLLLDGESRYSRQIAVILYNTMRFCRAEELEEVQLGALESVLDLLDQDEPQLVHARTADSVLLAAGLNAIPALEDE